MDEARAGSGSPAARPRRDTRARRILRWISGVVATLVILLALALGALRVLLTHVTDYREQIQAWVNDTTRLDVRFRALDARWRIYGPEIYITAVEVRAPHGGPLLAEARAASVGFDLWRALYRAELLAGRLQLIEPEIGLVRTADGRIELEGQAALERQSGARRMEGDDLPTGRLDIRDARVTFTDLQGELHDLILSAVDLTIRRDRDDLEIEGEIELPERMGSTLEIEARAHGALTEPGRVAWEIGLRARNVALAGWREHFGALAALPLSGRGSLRLDAALQGNELASANLRLQLSEVVLPASSGWPTPASYPVIAGDLTLRREGAAWRLTGRDLELSTDRHAWPASNLSASWQGDARGLTRLESTATFLRLDNLIPLLGLAPPGDWREKLVALSPEGEVRSLELGYVRHDDAEADMEVAARFADVGFNPLGRLPGLRGLTGEMRGSTTAGQVTIDSRAVLLTMPQKFRAPLSADLARGSIGWSRGDRGWHIESRQFELLNAHASARTDIDLTIPGDGTSPVLKLHSRFLDAVLAEGWRYLPIDQLRGRVLAWLDGAFLAGRAPGGELVIDGPTRNFPFRGGEGEFRVSFPVEGLDLNYAEGWPHLAHAALDVEFRNQGLTAMVKSGLLNGVEVREGVARIADFRQGDLAIEARAGGDLGAALGYVQQSPVGEKLGATFMQLRGSGPVAADVDLLLPIRHLDDRRITIASRLDAARVTLEGSEHTIDELAGTLRIEDRRVSSPALTGAYLGGPILIELAPTPQSGQIFENVVRVRATTPTAPLVKAMGAPESARLEGTLEWRATARVPIVAAAGSAPQTKPPATARFTSTLEGTAIGLPAPLAKSAAETRTLLVEVQWPQPGEALVRAALGSDLRSRLRFARAEAGWRLERGTLQFGAGDVPLPAMAGLELRGNVGELDLSEWLSLRSDKAGTRPLSEYLRSADFVAQDLRLFGFHFSDLRGSLLAGERAWSVSVDGPQARGTILVPYDLQGAEPLVINMSRLTLDEIASGPGGGRAREPDPSKWPDVDASIGEFAAWGKRFGFLRAELRRAPDGLQLHSLTTQSASFVMRGSGAWVVAPQGQHGNLKLELESTDVLQTMKELGYGESIAGKRAAVAADVSWPGAPSAHLLGRLSGSVSIQIDDGQLLNVQPGAGRIFGLMSVAALPRRLSLDFTDFTDKGLAFDSIRGDFTLTTGDAFTENLLLKGPAAEIGVIGRTGLERRDYDQTAVVTGSLGQSLPVAGALAGGPVVGAALLVFSQIFKEPLKGITRGYYRITGSWDNPVVQRVDGSDKKEARSAVRTAERTQDQSR